MDDKCRSFLKENGINADAALEFMMGCERMFEKYLYRFTEDPTFPELFSSIKEQRREEARSLIALLRPRSLLLRKEDGMTALRWKRMYRLSTKESAK